MSVDLGLETWAVLVSAGGIIATCVVESLWYSKQMKQQTKHFDTQIQQQSQQLQAQFNFEINASREQRILQSQRDTLEQVRRIANNLTVLEKPGTSPSDLLDCLHSLDFELFALVAMTNTLANDSEQNYSVILRGKVKDLANSFDTLTTTADDRPNASTMDSNILEEVSQQLQEFAALILRLQPKKMTIAQL